MLVSTLVIACRGDAPKKKPPPPPPSSGALVDLKAIPPPPATPARSAPAPAATSPGGAVLNQGQARDLVFWTTADGALRLIALSWDGVLAGGDPKDRELNRLQIWDPSTSRVVATARDVGMTTSISVASQAHAIAMTNLDDAVSVRALPTFEARWSVTIDGAKLVKITADGKRVFVGDEHGSVRMLDGTSGKVQWKQKILPDYVAGFDLSPNGRYLAVGGDGKFVSVIDTRSRQVIARLPHAAPTDDKYGGIYTLAFAPDGNSLATAGVDDKVRVFAVPSGKLVRTLDGEGQVLALAWSPDSGTLAYGGNYDGPAIKVARFAAEHVDHITGAHKLALTALTFSPDGKQLVSGSRDKTMRIMAVQPN